MEHIFCQSFVVEVPGFGDSRVVPLKEGGADIPVTGAWWLLAASVGWVGWAGFRWDWVHWANKRAPAFFYRNVLSVPLSRVLTRQPLNHLHLLNTTVIR